MSLSMIALTTAASLSNLPGEISSSSLSFFLVMYANFELGWSKEYSFLFFFESIFICFNMLYLVKDYLLGYVPFWDKLGLFR